MSKQRGEDEGGIAKCGEQLRKESKESLEDAKGGREGWGGVQWLKEAKISNRACEKGRGGRRKKKEEM